MMAENTTLLQAIYHNNQDMILLPDDSRWNKKATPALLPRRRPRDAVSWIASLENT
jgi:hypothetical protein